MAPCVYLNWRLQWCPDGGGQTPRGLPQRACAHVRASACVLHRPRCHTNVRSCPDVSAAVWHASEPVFGRMTSSFTGGLWSFRRAASVSWSGCSRPGGRAGTVTFLPANVKQHFPPRLLMWRMGSSISRVGISQRGSTACLILLPRLPPHSAPGLSPDSKAQVIGRTVSGANGLADCLSSFSVDWSWSWSFQWSWPWSLEPGTGRSVIDFVTD